MRIQQVTITGADNNVSIPDLQGIQDEFPFVEWGILFGNGNATGANRYPSFRWVQELEGKGLNLSGHLCGDYARQVVLRHDTTFMEFYTMFQRFQLNVNFNLTKINHLDVAETLEKFSRPLIFQWNLNNKDAVHVLEVIAKKAFHVLYDASGGTGKVIKSIPAPYGTFGNVYTGYAGGIDPDNVAEICEKITTHPDKSWVWIDMESGVRTNDELDLDKVRKVLATVKQFM